MPREDNVLPDFTPGVLTLGSIPCFSYSETVANEVASGRLPTERLLDLYRWALTVRAFEEMIVAVKGGKYAALPGFRFIGATHLSIGQEAVAAGAITAIGPLDYITSTHRGHGHAIVKGAYALTRSSREELEAFCVLPEVHGATLEERAFRTHLVKTAAELFGKECGYCAGRGGGMHIADFHTGHLGANAIVGGSSAMAAGAALSAAKLHNGKLCLGIVGDGAVNNGIFHEACNFAAQDQFKPGLPVIFLVENNQYGMSGQQVREVTGIYRLAQRGAGYNEQLMHAETVNGMRVLAVHDAVSRAAEVCRNGDGPVLLECITYRYMGHSLSDQFRYRSKDEETAWRAIDPCDWYERELIEAGVITADDALATREWAAKEIEYAATIAGACHDPDPAEIERGLFSPTSCVTVPAEFHVDPVTLPKGPPKRTKRDSSGAILYRHAVAEALTEEMLRDRRVVVYGEDVADYGGAFQATVGLLDDFGRDRVFNTPISEAAVIGTGTGAAMTGLRPVVEIMYIDFILMTMDQLGNQAAKNRYMFGGKATVPMVVRTTIGGGKGYAGQHSQSLEAICTQIPGLKVVAPSTPADVKGLLKTSIRDDNVVVFIEHQNLYAEKGPVPEDDDFTIPLGVGVVRREGTDVTLVGYSFMARVAEQAADLLAESGVSAEVIDPRTLIPFDYELVAASVRKTGHLVALCQAPVTGCFAEHIVTKTQELAFHSMKQPARIIAAYDVPPPMAAPLEAENIPSPEKVARETLKLLGR
jgi:2-oxoisovalerate dehydrogenase E1 component